MPTTLDLNSRIAELRSKRRDLVEQRDAVVDRASSGVGIATGHAERASNLDRGVERLDAEIDLVQAEARDQIRDAVLGGQGRIESGSDGGVEPSFDRGGEYSAGRRNIDDAARSGQLPDHAAQAATLLLEQGTPEARTTAARWAAAAGAPEYRSAFAKLLADPDRGHLLWSAREADAYRQAAHVNADLQRAMSLTGSAGGFMVPLTLDPAIMLSSDGSNNPLRKLARVVQTSSNTWQGVTSAGATSEWIAEATQVADGSPTLGSPSIPVLKGDSFVPYSYEVGMDAENFLQELGVVLRDSADSLQAAAYTVGNGTTQPQGIVTGLAGTASEINAAGEAIVSGDIYGLQNALPARFSSGATWQSHIATGNSLRQLETANGALRFPGLHETPATLLGKPWHENSNMDGTLNAAATASNFAVIYGDVAKGFVIVDRIGSTLELIPHLMGANGRPTGQRGALLWFRTGSEVVVPEALRMLDVATTA